MDENDLKIVKVTNISNFDFNGDRGARFGGRDYLIPAGESLMVPFHAGEHFAKHLAHAMLLQQAPERTDKELGGKGSSAALWNDEAIKELMGKIITYEFTEEKVAPKSESDKMFAKIEELNKGLTDPETGDSPITDTKAVYKDKAQVIAELEKRGVTFNPRDSKAVLETLLEE